MNRKRPRELSAVAPWLTITLLLSVVALPLGAMHPNHRLGVDPTQSLQSGAEGIDLVDLYSGGLSLNLPIGPFTLVYSSNVWHYQVDETTGAITARPHWEHTGGLGFHLGWGEIYHPDYTLNDTGRWLYVDGSGSRHVFYDKLHKDDGDDGDDKIGRVHYSRDGSYLRLRISQNNCHAYLEEPNGNTRRFTGSCGPQTTYRLMRIWSPFASEADPDVTVTYGVDPADPSGTSDTLRTVTNRYGLTHKVYLSDTMNGDPKDPVHWVRRIVTRVELEAFGGQTAAYDFTYRQIHVDVSCKDTSTSTPARIEVPHLERIDLPDGTSYRMEEAGSLLYENQCRSIDGAMVDDLPGALIGVDLPTGGKIRWDYQRYELPPGHTASVFYTNAGVKNRILKKADGTTFGTWTYKSTTIATTGSGSETTDPEMHMEVVHPTGHCTKHFFDARYWATPSEGKGWELGLPFVYSEESGGRYLSSQVYTGNDGNRSCDPATKLRSTYLRFRHDPPPGQAPTPTNGVTLGDFYNTNRQVDATRVVFHDDGDWYVDTERSDFDGLGHFRREVETGNLWGAQQRETTLGYNRSGGTYPGAYTVLLTSEPWILGVHDSIETTDLGASGATTSRSEFAFEDTTGFLSCSRILASGNTRGPADLLTVYARDPLGNVVDTKLYGGDLQALATTGGECGTVPSQPSYWTSHEYDPLSGVLVTSRPRTAAGTYGAFPVFDVDVEPRTGIVTRSRDTAGFQVSFAYDAAGRLTSATPQSGAVELYSYTNPTATTGAKVGVIFQPAAGGAALAQSEQILDDFGRTRLERRKMPAGVWSERESAYNARGWLESVSEWGDLGKKTLFLSHDPFGRPTVFRPPDGSAHDRLRSYRGERVVWETSKLALAGGEGPATRTSLYDAFGRLRRVWENSGTGGAPEQTSYSYDVADRLTGISAGQQQRSFTYDGRGFLLAQTDPELGAAGNGTVTFSEYDAAGLPHHRDDGANDLGYTFDFLGRLLEIRDRSQGNHRVSQYVWDGTGVFAKGKLRFAKRYNYLDLPWNAAGEETVMVRQSFVYGGIGGRASRKTTRILWSADDARFKQSFFYDELGNLKQRNTPYCNLPVACIGSDAGVSQAVTFTYDQGYLTAVPGWASQITYHPSGLWKQITHTNGVAEHQDRDDFFSHRTKRLFTSGVFPGWDSGLMSYDGSGNLKAQGSDVFTYDPVSRLVNASYGGGDLVQGFDYDRWGNITAVTGDTIGMFTTAVDPATNRLASATYDAAGNMLTAPPPHPAGQYLYDTDNRLVAQAWMRYLYDPFGERVASIANVPQEGAVFHLRDLDQRLVANIRMNQGTWSRDRDYVFAGDRLVGRSAPGQPDYHFHLDRLGSVRMTTLGTGDYAGENFFMPYGENFGSGSTADSLLFAGPHERDFSTDTDSMHARHFWWKLGRFLSVDPAPGEPALPQSLNRYAYALGNPINRTDPDGRSSILYCREDGSCTYTENGITVTASGPKGFGPGPIILRYGPLPGRGPGPGWRDELWAAYDIIDVVANDPAPAPEPPAEPDPDPHLHAQGEVCSTFARPFAVSTATGPLAAYGQAIGSLAESSSAIPVTLSDPRTRARAMGMTAVSQLVGSRAIALAGKAPPPGMGVPARGGTARRPGSTGRARITGPATAGPPPPPPRSFLGNVWDTVKAGAQAAYYWCRSQ